MADMKIVPKLDRQQALDCGQRFRDGITSAHQAVLEFFEGAGWEALGYASFEAAAKPVFGYSFQYLYKIKDAALIERNIALPASAPSGASVDTVSGMRGGGRPPGETIPQIPVDHARALKNLTDPRDQKKAYMIAQQAAADANRKVTKTDVQEAIRTIKVDGVEADRKAVFESGFVSVVERMNAGLIKPAAARQVVDALCACEPTVWGNALQLDIFNPAIIRELNRLYLSGRESYGEIIRSKALQFADGSYVPIALAKPNQLAAYLREKQQEHILAGRAVHTGRIQWASVIVALDEDAGTVTFQLPGDSQLAKQIREGVNYLVDLSWDTTRERMVSV